MLVIFAPYSNFHVDHDHQRPSGKVGQAGGKVGGYANGVALLVKGNKPEGMLEKMLLTHNPSSKSGALKIL